jgi:crotonobetainyl-CoA:carnitine CoA-transferase CaiB-like acyl-CoA transferase
MALLNGFRVVQLGPGLSAAVCGRMLADCGARVTRIGAEHASRLGAYLNAGSDSAGDELRDADLIVAEGSPATLRRAGHDVQTLRAQNGTAAITLISPFGQTGPRAEVPATDLTLFFSSGIARMLTGQVDDLSEAPIRPAGEQSAFIGGLAAACAGMHAALAREPAVVDVSIQEALATLAMTELTRAGLTGKSWPRRRVADGNGATVCILPAADGYAAISPREEKQWAAWLEVMGSPEWGREPRFAAKKDRVANWDALHALMSAWSRGKTKQWIANAAQAAHVPSFPLREPMEQLATPQLEHRGFYRSTSIDGREVRVPGPPLGLTLHPGVPAARELGLLPLSGVRVLDFSWVIAGPTTTRYLAAMGAEVIKVEAPGRGDPGRASELHTVLGQAKKAIVLDLKNPDSVATAKALAAQCDVLVENFATGVMDRLGLGADALRTVAPGLIYVSASGLGRTGPEAHSVAYGTLLQCYAGFAGLNRHPGVAPRVGMAWLDPMCGLMLAFAVAASIWQRRRTGAVARIDLSMVEALLWTMADKLLTAQLSGPPQPMGNENPDCVPHGAWPAASEDAWVAVAVPDDDAWHALCGVVPGLADLAKLDIPKRRAARAKIEAAIAAWLRDQDAAGAVEALARAGVPAAQAVGSMDLVRDGHLGARGFWEDTPAGVLPGLPWIASYGRATGPAPDLGADTDRVLSGILGLSGPAIANLRRSGAVG